MSEQDIAPVAGTRRPLGCLVRLTFVAAIVVGVVVVIGTIFDQGDSARPVRGYNAGPAEAYQHATVNYIEPTHAYIVRLADGAYLALYDKPAKQQELRNHCRVTFIDDAGIGTLEPLPGIKGAFVEQCGDSRAVWRADGAFAFGAGYGDLDRFRTSINAQGDLIIDTDNRTCTRSRGVIGLPPFDVRTCRGAD